MNMALIAIVLYVLPSVIGIACMEAILHRRFAGVSRALSDCVIDDRNERHQIRRKPGGWPVPVHLTPEVQQRLRRLSNALRKFGTSSWMAMGSLGVAAFATPYLLLEFFTSVWIVPESLTIPLVAMTVTVALSGIYYAHRSRFYKAQRNSRDVLLSCQLCPCCLYDVRDAPHVDATIVCPECGAAWKERVE
ncbi:MAG: hypothetical protein EA377_10850 [Phycisphaerales bacterium]|nr:MAG: hypothetical protein EA377_10850 [Phycisphaerales bacterium]